MAEEKAGPAPAQPTLARIDTGDGQRDLVIQPTKQGFVFVLDRDTGKPVWPVEERAVPQGGAEGEKLSPTQPFPTHVPPLLPQSFSLDDQVNFPPVIGSPSCDALLRPLRNEGLYTPPSTQGTLVFPMTGGGVNWGSAAFDPMHQILYANTTYAIHVIKLISRAQANGMKPEPGEDLGPQIGAPFAMAFPELRCMVRERAFHAHFTGYQRPRILGPASQGSSRSGRADDR